MEALLEKALQGHRLGHGLILHGKNEESVRQACLGLAARLLDVEDPTKHGDFFVLRPVNKSRRIDVDSIRRLNKELRYSAQGSGNKVALVEEADRMNAQSSNAFLKTLEEPPAGTFILLETTRPERLLETIRSRCYALRVPGSESRPQGTRWEAMEEALRSWLRELEEPLRDKKKISAHFFRLYGLIDHLQFYEKERHSREWQEIKKDLPESFSQEERDAAEVGLQRKVRAEVLSGLAWIVRDFCLDSDQALDTRQIRKMDQAVRNLEETSALLNLNLNPTAALEAFFLKLLRLWTRQ